MAPGIKYWFRENYEINTSLSAWEIRNRLFEQNQVPANRQQRRYVARTDSEKIIIDSVYSNKGMNVYATIYITEFNEKETKLFVVLKPRIYTVFILMVVSGFIAVACVLSAPYWFAVVLLFVLYSFALTHFNFDVWELEAYITELLSDKKHPEII